MSTEILSSSNCTLFDYYISQSTTKNQGLAEKDNINTMLTAYQTLDMFIVSSHLITH